MVKEVVDVFRNKPKTFNKSLNMSLPVPPSVNALHYNTSRGGRKLTPKAIAFTAQSRALINLAVEEQRWDKQGKGVWLYIDMVFYFPDRKIRDASNCLKILLDVMEGIVYDNDYVCLPRIQSVEYDKLNPRVELRITHQTKNNRDKGIKTTKVVL